MRFGLVGTYDVENYGDCYFPELWAAKLSARFDDAEITLFSPTSRPADILTERRLQKLPDNMQSRITTPDGTPLDALILTGGETLGLGHDSGTYIFPRHNFSHFTRLWAAPVLEAARSRTEGGPTRFAVHAAGMPPMPAAADAQIARGLVAADYVSTRDVYSKERLRAHLNNDPDDDLIDIAADPMFLLDDLDTPDGWMNRAAALLPKDFTPASRNSPGADGGYIAAQISHSYLDLSYPDWIDALTRIAQTRGKPVLLVPVCHFLNDEIVLAMAAEALAARGVKAALLPGRINVKDTAAVLSAASGIVCSSLHAAVTAVVFKVPLAVLSHSLTGKHQGTLETIGISRAVTTVPAELPEILSGTEVLDFADARAKGRARAEASLDGVLAALADDSRRGALPDLATVEGAIDAITRHEAATAVIRPIEIARRTVFGAMMQIGNLRDRYEQQKLRSRLRRYANLTLRA